MMRQRFCPSSLVSLCRWLLAQRLRSMSPSGHVFLVRILLVNFVNRGHDRRRHFNLERFVAARLTTGPHEVVDRAFDFVLAIGWKPIKRPANVTGNHSLQPGWSGK